MNALPHHILSLEEYFELELSNETKFEYCGGAVLAMAGGSVHHNATALRVAGELLARMPRTCHVFGSDQRVACADGLHTYPDGVVACGELQLSTYRGTDTLHNPALIVEVLSKSTRAYDLGEKLEHYQTIPSLREVLLIEPEVVDVRHVVREGDGWVTHRVLTRSAVLELQTHGVRLPLSAMYVSA